MLPSTAETVEFGGFAVEPELAFFAVLLTGLLLLVVMAPPLQNIVVPAGWVLTIAPLLYAILGGTPKQLSVRREDRPAASEASEDTDNSGGGGAAS